MKKEELIEHSTLFLSKLKNRVSNAYQEFEKSKFKERALNIFKELELNKTTEDVQLDIKHLQIGTTLKAYAFYGISIGLGIGVYFYVYSFIIKDDFRSKLINQANVAPLMSFFYTDYSKDKDLINKINSQKAFVATKINELQKLNKSSSFSYSKQEFMQDLKNKSITLDLSKFEKQKQEFMQDYYFSILIQKKSEKISLEGTEYTISEIANKIQNIEFETAKEHLKLPVEKIIEKYALAENDSEIITYALYNMNKINYNLSKFYQYLQLDMKFEDLVDRAILNNVNYIAITSNNGQMKKIDFSTILNEKYNEVLADKKTKFEVEKANFEKEKAAKMAELKSFQEQEKLLNQMISVFNSFNNDLSKYSVNKDKLKKLEKEIKWNK